MGLGVLDVDGPVQGSVNLLERAHALQSRPYDPTLKYDRGRGSEPILLVPQPTDDPRDPLNRPLWQRDAQLALLSAASVIATTLSPILAANSLNLAFYFETSFTRVAWLTAYHLLAVGLAGVLFVPSARVWGKRHLYILGAVLVCASCAWAGAARHSYGSLMAARVVQGIGLAPFEALVNASVADLFFVHERGKRMALSNLALFGGAFFTPVVAGKISVVLGWWWTFWLVAIFAGALVPAVVLFLPESAFRRPQYLMNPVPRAAQASSGVVEEANGEDTSQDGEKERVVDDQLASNASRACSASQLGTGGHRKPRVSYWTGLAPFDGRKTDDSFFILLLRPFPLFLQPGVLWCCLIQGTLIGWTVLIGIILAATLLGPPLWFSSVEVGYTYAGAFVGSLVGFAICGLIADPAAKFMARLNGGVFEPEFRMILVIPQLIIGSVGLYGFGFTSDQLFRYGWAGPTVLFGFEVAGVVCGAVASALYIADAHADIAIEAFTCLLMFKNIFAFGIALHGYDWIVALGIKKIFIIVGSVQVGVCLLTVPMYIFGKKNRAFWQRRVDMYRLLRLQ